MVKPVKTYQKHLKNKKHLLKQLKITTIKKNLRYHNTYIQY